MRHLMEAVAPSYARYANPRALLILTKFVKATSGPGGIKYSPEGAQAVGVKASAVYKNVKDQMDDDVERGHEPYAIDKDEIILETITETLEKMAFAMENDDRLEEFFKYNPDTEQSDELSYLTAENDLIKKTELFLEPTDSGFGMFLNALDTFGELYVPGAYNWGVDSGLSSCLSKALPLLILFFRKVGA